MAMNALKCDHLMPLHFKGLMYGLDVCALNKRSLQSLDFTVSRFCPKLFQTSDIIIVNECRTSLALSYLAYWLLKVW